MAVYNVHKTFATPHGSGGPVGVVEALAPSLSAPVVDRVTPEHTIGKVHGFEGNWPVLLKVYAYIARLGDAGLADASETAVLNANYLAERIEYDAPFGPFHHEFVASAGEQDAAAAATRMLDYGVHPPTTKWPEFVPEALMTEPTESGRNGRWISWPRRSTPSPPHAVLVSTAPSIFTKP